MSPTVSRCQDVALMVATTVRFASAPYRTNGDVRCKESGSWDRPE